MGHGSKAYKDLTPLQCPTNVNSDSFFYRVYILFTFPDSWRTMYGSVGENIEILLVLLKKNPQDEKVRGKWAHTSCELLYSYTVVIFSFMSRIFYMLFSNSHMMIACI